MVEAQRLFGFCHKHNAPPCNMVNILSRLFGMPLNIYRQTMIAWMEEHLQVDTVALNWWSLRGQDWPYYRTVLEAGYILDGLEIWAACQASGTHLNVVQQGQLWSSHAEGIDQDDYIVMILEEGVVYCDQVDNALKKQSAPSILT